MRVPTLLVALTASVLLSSTMAGATWASFHADERNTGFQSGSVYHPFQDVWWSVKLKNTQVEATPVVKDGLVVVAAWDHGLRAYDVESGKVKWNVTPAKATVAKYVATPAILGNKVFAVDTLGALEARDLQRGTLLDSAVVGATLAHPTIHEGKIFIGNEAGEMQAFDTETLTLLWKFQISSVSEEIIEGAGTTADKCGPKLSATGSQIRGAPAIYGGNVIFGSLNHWVFAVNEQGDSAQKTELRWMYRTDDAVFASPTVDDESGNVLIGSYDETVYALPASPSGQGPDNIAGVPCTAYKNAPEWTFEVPSDVGDSKVHSTIAIDNERAYFGANNGRVYAISLEGDQVWEFKTDDPVISSPAVSNDVVVVGSDDGNVYWLNANNGTKIKSFQADSPIKSNPALDSSRAFVTSFDGTIYMLGPKIPARPDLVVTSVSYDDGVFTVIVSNVGGAKSSTVSLRLNIDGALAQDLTVPEIEAGQSTTLTYNSDLGTGAHSISAHVDQAGALQESIETNNAYSSNVEVKKDDGKGFGIPGPSVPLILVALAMLVLVLRRR